jgi:hypothetical protein
LLLFIPKIVQLEYFEYMISGCLKKRGNLPPTDVPLTLF